MTFNPWIAGSSTWQASQELDEVADFIASRSICQCFVVGGEDRRTPFSMALVWARDGRAITLVWLISVSFR